MSAALLGMAFRAEMGSHVAKLVLLKLVDAAEDDGSRIFPAVATVARAAQAHERTVQRLIRVFVRAGLLVLVRKGGGGPGDTNEYRLDLGVLRRITETGWAVATGEVGESDADGDKGGTMPPLPKGGIDDAKGGIEGLKGGVSCHPTPPLEPSIDPSIEREGACAREAGSEPGSAAHLPHAEILEALRREAPTTIADDRDDVAAAWRRLKPDERREAAGRYGEWLADVKRSLGRAKLIGLPRYLRHKLWETLPDKRAPTALTTAYAAPWTRLWWWVILRFIEAHVDALADPRSAESSSLRRMVSAAQSRLGQRIDPAHRAALEEAAKALRQVHVDSADFETWRAHYAAKGVALPRPDAVAWVFLPATGPPAAGSGTVVEDVAAEAERALAR